MTFISRSLLVLTSAILASCGTGHPPLKTAGKVDLKRYAGRWHEIARYPHVFQRGCASSIAEYTPRPDGTVGVKNTCIRFDGGTRSVAGRAVPIDKNADRLRVRFDQEWFGRFLPNPKEGNYWIIDLSPDYRHAIVGTPSRNALWFLSRSPRITGHEFERMKQTAAAQGFDVRKLVIDQHTVLER